MYSADEILKRSQNLNWRNVKWDGCEEPVGWKGLVTANSDKVLVVQCTNALGKTITLWPAIFNKEKHPDPNTRHDISYTVKGEYTGLLKNMTLAEAMQEVLFTYANQERLIR